MGGYKERVLRSAFDGVSLSDCRLLFNHDKNKVLARTKSGTLKVTLDEMGLRFRATLPDTPTTSEIIPLMERGDVGECSWAFSLPYEGKSWSEDGKTLSITKIDRLWDVSLVTYPACPVTSAWLVDVKDPKDPFRSSERDEMADELNRAIMAAELSKARYQMDKTMSDWEDWNREFERNAPGRAEISAELRQWERKLGITL